MEDLEPGLLLVLLPKVLLVGVILAVVIMMTATKRIDDVAARYGDAMVYYLVLTQPCHCKTRINTIQCILHLVL
jgi:hypothetical protein